ncbi:MAG: hypothetical protein QXH45_06415 [Thermosphaera sp.]
MYDRSMEEERMKSIVNGVVRAVKELIESLLFSLVLGALFRILLGKIGVIIYLILSVISSIEIVERMKYWPIGYLAGYLLAEMYIVKAMPDPLEILIFSVGLIFLFIKLWNNVF